jgi:ketosteroid isomerase-like protein
VWQQNVEVVRQALSALDRRDVEAYPKLASPAYELINPASSIEGPAIGHEGIRRFFRELTAYSKESEFRLEDIRAIGERVLASFVITAVGRNSEVKTSVKFAGVYDLEHGKIRRAEIFADRAEALEAAGLSE